MLDRNQPVAQLVLEHPECARVFQHHRIDFCCHGEQSVAAAAHARKLDVAALVDELDAAIRTRSAQPGQDPRTLTTPQLIAHIVNEHHAYLRENLPLVRTLAAKVSRVHGEHDLKLRVMAAVVEELAETLLPHVEEEEQHLFVALTATPSDQAALARELQSMREDHLAVGALLSQLRDATDEFSPPEWACNSYRTLFRELMALESDIMTHVQLENHVLAPRFAERDCQ
jgi:regulator of cell morphogenesis and NO signaling